MEVGCAVRKRWSFARLAAGFACASRRQSCIWSLVRPGPRRCASALPGAGDVRSRSACQRSTRCSIAMLTVSICSNSSVRPGACRCSARHSVSVSRAHQENIRRLCKPTRSSTTPAIPSPSRQDLADSGQAAGGRRARDYRRSFIEAGPRSAANCRRRGRRRRAPRRPPVASVQDAQCLRVDAHGLVLVGSVLNDDHAAHKITRDDRDRPPALPSLAIWSSLSSIVAMKPEMVLPAVARFSISARVAMAKADCHIKQWATLYRSRGSRAALAQVVVLAVVPLCHCPASVG